MTQGGVTNQVNACAIAVTVPRSARGTLPVRLPSVGKSGTGVWLFVLMFALASPRTTHAETSAQAPDLEGRQARWSGEWSDRNVWDYSIAGAGSAALIAEVVVLQPLRPPLRWTDPILFDKDVRSALRVSNPSTQNTLEDVSWALWGLQLAYPVLVDVPLAWAHGDHELAQDLFWQDAVTLPLAAAVDLGLRELGGRARPPVYDCLAAGGTNCLGNVETTRSFPGGHILNSTAASVLTCTQHLYVPLYEGPWDGVVCASSLAPTSPSP